VGRNGIIRLDIKQLTGKHISFPQEELPQQYIDHLVDIDAKHPFQMYVNTLTLYFDGLFALNPLDADNHPQLQALPNHTILNSRESQDKQELWHELYPDVPIPSPGYWEGQELDLEVEEMRSEKALDSMANKYREFFGTRTDAKSLAYAEALDLIATEMYKKPEKLIEIGINSYLIRYLATGVNRDLIRPNKSDARVATEENYRSGLEPNFRGTC